jgi:hypothetical protein
VRLDQACIGVGDRIGAQVVVLDPRQSSACEGLHLRSHQWFEADVACLGQQRGAHADRQIVGASAVFVDVVKSEAKPVQVWTSNSSSGNSTRGRR